jgi:hypothetical protein
LSSPVLRKFNCGPRNAARRRTLVASERAKKVAGSDILRRLFVARAQLTSRLARISSQHRWRSNFANAHDQPDSGQQFTRIQRRIFQIFQTWKVRSPLPAAFELWSRTIKEKNKNYEYVIRISKLYPAHAKIRKLAGRTTRKLSVTESQNSPHFLGTSSRRKLRMASANSRHVG